MLPQVKTYQDASRARLAQARAELGQGDTRQASEKGWGAAAQMLKSIAEQRGWDHRSHRHIRRTATQLVQETGDREISRLYRVASDLHTNFYEDSDSPNDVLLGLDDIQTLLDKLEPLLNPAAAAT